MSKNTESNQERNSSDRFTDYCKISPSFRGFAAAMDSTPKEVILRKIKEHPAFSDMDRKARREFFALVTANIFDQKVPVFHKINRKARRASKQRPTKKF